MSTSSDFIDTDDDACAWSDSDGEYNPTEESNAAMSSGITSKSKQKKKKKKSACRRQSSIKRQSYHEDSDDTASSEDYYNPPKMPSKKRSKSRTSKSKKAAKKKASDNNQNRGSRSKKEAVTRRSKVVSYKVQPSSSSESEIRQESDDDESCTSGMEEELDLKMSTKKDRVCEKARRRAESKRFEEVEEEGARPKKRKRLRRMKRKTARKLEAEMELEELRKDQNSWSVRNKENDEEAHTSDDEKGSDKVHLPIEPMCPKCLNLMQHRNRNVDAKLFFTCVQCNHFMWPDVAYKNMPNGPPCKCGKPSYPQTSGEAQPFGQSLGIWYCANTSDKEACDFELPIALDWWERRDQVNTKGDHKPNRPGSLADEQFLVGAASKKYLQDIFHVDYNDSKSLDNGRGYYDFFHVHRAWRVSSPSSTLQANKAFREGKKGCCVQTVLRHQEAMKDLMAEDSGIIEPLCQESNEVLLLHGTKPEAVANTLEQGLDPAMARAGLFGAGTYFAEHPAKINQYTTLDERWQGRSNTPMGRTHRKLYPNPDLHGGQIYYALVCRVVLGAAESTYQTRRSGPSQGHYSLIAENGNGSDPVYREFIIFDKDAIKIEYIVAYKRTKHYCNCGTPVRERTMPENNQQRPVIACNGSHRNADTGRWEGGCGLFAKVPRCFCRNNRQGDFWGAQAKPNENLYCCRVKRCGFREPITYEHEYSDGEEDSEGDDDDLDGFIVKG